MSVPPTRVGRPSVCPPSDSDRVPSTTVHFDGHPIGPYTDAMVRADWGQVPWIGLSGRARIVPLAFGSSGQGLEMMYPKGGVGPQQSGGQFLVKLRPRDEYTLEYSVMFRDGFDFRLGGKLPGLAGGRANTGGHKPTGDGWSARYMWKDGGKMVVYLYHMDQPGVYGENVPLHQAFATGQWYRLKQYVKVNSPEKSDGVLRVWIDGTLALDRNDIRYRTGAQAPVDKFYFSTFHGGDTSDWAPQNNGSVYFDDFSITP